LRDTVLCEIETLLEQQPLLSKTKVDGGVNIIGKYKICNQLEDEVFEDYFAIEIFVPDGFPDDIPAVKTTDGRIRASNYKEHVYTDGQFCLEIDTAIVVFLQDNPSLLVFLTRYLDTYLCGFLFYRKHKRLPFGERKHGISGLMDYYCELFDITDIKATFSLLTCLFKDNLKGHIQCPCQSGKRYRNCHRERINELRSSRLYERYKSDFATIIAELNKQNKR
jgi:ubiquitin-protein ligase